MTVFALIPVHNRLADTQSMVAMLRSQKTRHDVKIIVINDGSTDGTTEWLSENEDILAIHGNGELWWGGAIQEGYKICDRQGNAGDWVLLVNNDSEIPDDFVASLIEVAESQAPAAVTALLRDVKPPHKILSVGPIFDRSALSVVDWTINDNQEKTFSENQFVAVEALSGRGVLYPLDMMRAVGGMRTKRIPHYFADYELSVRVAQMGAKLLAATNTAVYSIDDYGSQKTYPNWKLKYFSIRSSSYLPAMLSFWWSIGTFGDRILLPVRALRRVFIRKG